MTDPTPQEVDDLLDEIYAAEWDYWMDDEEPSDDEPDDEEPTALVEEEDQGWRQWDFL